MINRFLIDRTKSTMLYNLDEMDRLYNISPYYLNARTHMSRHLLKKKDCYVTPVLPHTFSIYRNLYNKYRRVVDKLRDCMDECRDYKKNRDIPIFCDTCEYMNHCYKCMMYRALIGSICNCFQTFKDLLDELNIRIDSSYLQRNTKNDGSYIDIFLWSVKFKLNEELDSTLNNILTILNEFRFIISEYGKPVSTQYEWYFSDKHIRSYLIAVEQTFTRLFYHIEIFNKYMEDIPEE